MTRVFARGLNFMGQLGIVNGKNNLKEFHEIPALMNSKVIQVEAHLAQSACLLDDGQILNWGWVLDSLTTARTLSYYKRAPKLAKSWQKYSFLGPTLGMRSGIDEPSLLNKSIVFKSRSVKISMGGSFVLCRSSDGEAFGAGENYKGQLGTGDIKFKHNFTIIDKGVSSKVVDVAAGFQHSLLLLEDGSCLGSGRCNWRQFQPYSTDQESSLIFYDFYKTPQRMLIPGEKIIKISAGFSHSLFYTSKGTLYATGLNNFGQCGQSSLNKTSLKKCEPVFVSLDEGENIIDIQSGKSHNILLTDKGQVYGFGASSHNQLNWRNEVDIEVCGPRKIELPIRDERIIKIKSTLDRSAAITDKGNCYVWGGENFDRLNIENHSKVQNLRELVPGNPRVIDVGLGFMHTIALTEK